MNMPLVLLNRRRRGGAAAFTPAGLFALAEPGVWYDPSDLTTLFQDTAGTTPVTTPGQTVARVNDKSGRGNNATQATLASRPTYGIVPLGGRRNLLTRTEEFENAVWTKLGLNAFGSGSVANTTVTTDPLGGNAADFISENTSTGSHYVNSPLFTYDATSQYTLSAYVKAAGRTKVQLWSGLSTPRFVVVADLSAITATGAAVGTGTHISSSITPVGNGWYRVSVTGTMGAAGAANPAVLIDNGSGNSYTGDGSSGVYVWGAQLETGSSATAYQRVGSAFDVTEAGVASLSYLNFNGINNSMITPTITPGVDKAQVFAGVRKLANGNNSCIVELSASASSNNGALYILTGRQLSGPAPAYTALSRGTVIATVDTADLYNAPIDNLLTLLGDISGDRATLRVNGTQVAQSTADQGTGNYLAYPLYIGMRAGTSLPFNGNLFSLIVRFGTNLDAGTITSTETWVNGKTGAYA